MKELLAMERAVLHYKDGKILKGRVLNFSQENAEIIFRDRSGFTRSVDINELKGMFFVKNFDGIKGLRQKTRCFEKSYVYGKKVIIRFSDGEEIFSNILEFDDTNIGFFFTPSNYESNNISIYAPFSAVEEIRHVITGEYPSQKKN